MEKSALFLLISNVILIHSFNIDTDKAGVISKNVGDYFGYAVALHKSGNKFWALVGAPLGTDNNPLEGVVYRCDLSQNNICGRIPLSIGASIYQNLTNQWMGASLLSFGVNQDIVACAPRFKDVPSRLNLWLHGRCAIINGETFALKSFWNPANKEVKLESYNSYGYPLQGFSIARSNSTKPHLITGMPGARRSLGALGYDRLLKINGASSVPFTISDNDRLEQADYMGYSVAWGQFSKRLYGDMVGGAPKGSYGKGKVLIYEMGGNLNIRSVIENTDAASYTGSYFGAALCTADLNNDGKPDLIIGAPLFTTKEEDEGKVYIYLSDSQGAVNEVSQIAGETRGGRFGTTISAVGDLNRDGFPDVAIGSPYGGPDGHGAVYIYHGSINGLETQAVQKIYASDFSQKPRGFGQSISGEMDIDSNGYPDIIIGSYLSSHVHILKSRPILKMTGEVNLNRTKVSLSGDNVKPCRVIQSVDYECIEVQFCLQYTGFSVLQSIDVQVEIETDKGKIGQKRAIMIEGGKEKSLVSFRKTYTKDKKNCTTLTIYVQQSPSSLSSGITVSANYKYIQPTSGCSGVCPVADYASKGLSSQVLEKEITYLRGCKSETKCIADLKVKGKAEIPGGLSKIEYGVVDKFTLKLSVENIGENAFLSKMTIQYADDFEPIGVKFINDQPPLWEKEKVNGKNILKFPLASPFVPNRKLDIDVSFSVAKQRPSAKKLSFEIEAKSDGSDDKNTDDNKVKIELGAGLRADLTVSGTATPYEIRYDKEPIAKVIKNETEVGAVVNYEFLVQNLGPAPVQGISARISLVTEYQQKYVAMLFSAQVKNSYCNITGKVNPDKLKTIDAAKTRRRRAIASTGVSELNCRSAQCITFDCYIGLLKRGEPREINLRTRIYQNTFIEGSFQLTKLTSTVTINIDPTEKDFLTQPGDGKPDSAKVSVFVGPQLEDKKGETTKVAWWIILLAVLGAIILIAAAIAGLYKVGFFERKKGKEISGPNVDD